MDLHCCRRPGALCQTFEAYYSAPLPTSSSAESLGKGGGDGYVFAGSWLWIAVSCDVDVRSRNREICCWSVQAQSSPSLAFGSGNSHVELDNQAILHSSLLTACTKTCNCPFQPGNHWCNVAGSRAWMCQVRHRCFC